MSISHLIVTRFSLAGVVLLFLFSCGDKNKASGDQEGVIEFVTRAIDETHPLYGFAPDAATLKFKKNKFVMDMSTMGMFNMSIIGDTRTQTMAQTIKFMNIKQVCYETAEDLKNDNLQNQLKFEETKETRDILGFKCYKVKVIKVNEPGVKFDAWYTKELGMDSSNLLTPYAAIKGVLLDYRIKKWGMEMRFVAKSFKNVEVPDNSFDVPPGMEVVTREQMDKFFKDLQ